jgi:hypothetical protein
VEAVGVSAAAAQQPEGEELIHNVLNSLVRERQDLRRRDGDRALLEANRLAIVYWQHELARRLIENSG